MAANDKDYYDILGVPRSASTEEIKKAYREKAMKFHPDRNQGDSDAEEKFKEASEAYSVLGNPEKRSIYDQFGIDGLKRGGRGFSENGFFSDSIFADFEDIIGNFFGFGSPFSRGERGHRPRRGRDIGIEVLLTLEETYKGVEKEIEVERETHCATCGGDGSEPGTSPETCRQCGGSGSVRNSHGFFSIATTCPLCRGSGRMITHPCKDCHGTGRIRAKKEIKITLPAGIAAGNKLRVSGEGEAGSRNGRAGDLYLIIDVKDDKRFRREGNDLVADMEISFAQAALGDEVTLGTFSGSEKIKIPPETQTGTVHRVKGKGFKNVNGWGRGDLLVVFHIVTPRKLSREEKKLFGALREIEAGKRGKESTQGDEGRLA